MADQWYYSQQNQQKGPVPEEQLRQLATSGQIQPTDLAWKQGMAQWVQVGTIIPPPPPDPNAPPPLPIQSIQHDALAAATGMAASLLSRGKEATQLVAKQAERTKLGTVTLPNAYHALGQHIYAKGAYRADFASIYQKIDAPLNEIKAIQEHNANQPKAEGLAGKAKAAAQATKGIAQVQLRKKNANHALAELGKAAFEQYKEQSGPAELVRPIVDGRSRMESLNAEISQLGQSHAGKIVTPKRMAIAGVAVACFLLLAIGKSMFFGSTSPSDSVHEYSARQEKKLTELVQSCAALAKTNPQGAVDLLRNTLLSHGDYEDILKLSAQLPNEDQQAFSKVWNAFSAHRDAENRELEQQEVRGAGAAQQGGGTSGGTNFYGEPRKDENGFWISGEEAYRRQVHKDAQYLENQMKKGQWEK
jgi:hypothetical protein